MATEKPVHRVLHVIAHMEKGGAERQLHLLVSASRHQHVITVLPGNNRPSPAVVELLPGTSPVAIYRSMRQMIRQHDIEIVQLWLPDRITIPAMMAARAEGCHIISGDRRRVRNYGRAAIRDRLNYINHVAADLVIPNYPHFPPRLSLRRLLGIPKHTQTIYNGLELETQRPSLTKVPSRLLFVGRLVEQKRVNVLIDIMPELARTAGIEGLDIIGDGPLAETLQSQAQRVTKPGQVTFHGYHTDWGTMFSPSSHALILPSASEGMSNTLFEAMAWGFLPIVTQTPELDAIMQGWKACPRLIDPQTPKTIVEAVSQLRAQSPDQVEQHIRDLQDSLGLLTVDRMVSAYDAVYDRLCSPSQVKGIVRDTH